MSAVHPVDDLDLMRECREKKTGGPLIHRYVMIQGLFIHKGVSIVCAPEQEDK